MLVTKLGEELAVRLPQDVVEALGLKEGDVVDVKPAGAKLLEVKRTKTIKDPEERRRSIRELRESWRGWVPSDFKFDREEANER